MPPLRRAGHMCVPACHGRWAAMAAGQLVWDADAGGWIFTDLPPRESDPAVLVRYAYGKVDKIWHGKPYTFDVCSWCGGDLSDPRQTDSGEATDGSDT